MSHKKRDGIVFSTNPEYKYTEKEDPVEETLAPQNQQLYVWLESKGRAGKTVTLIKGFKGSKEDRDELGGLVKKFCGTGGSVKEGDIIVQGDFRDKICAFLVSKGYKVKKAGG